MDKNRARELAIISDKIRKSVLTAVYSAASGHPGGSLSIADLLSVLYFEVMNVDPKNPKMEDRDRFVLSKGHCSPALYGVLAEKVSSLLKTSKHSEKQTATFRVILI